MEMMIRSRRPISALFDYIGGTSTGSIISAALTVRAIQNKKKPALNPSDVLKIFLDEGGFIFDEEA